MIRPLHQKARSALFIKKGDLIVPIAYGSDRAPTDKVQYAAFDTVTVISKRFFRGTVDVQGDLNLSATMTFRELGVPRFVVPFLRLGRWNELVCTVPRATALDLMRQYIDAHREPINRGPGSGPFDLVAISENKLQFQRPEVRTPWDRDKIAS